jgi:signal transduction histidine kinase
VTRRRPQLTIRARLTLIYTGLFAVCGAIIVAVSYTLVARLGVVEQAQQLSTSTGVAASLVAQCKSAYVSGDKRFLATKCPYSVLAGLGAQSQRALTLSHLLRYSLITLGALIALAAMLGWIFSGRALRPVQKITAAARAASQHNLSARVAPTGPRDDLRELAETFDDMLSRLQTAFEAQQQFIANASHELRTPLAVMATTIDVVVGNPDSSPGELRAMAADIRAAVDHAEHLIAALLILARNERGLTVHEEVDLATLAEGILDTAGLSDRQLHATLHPALISGDPVLAEHLIANLVDNAVRYNLAAGDIWISTRSTAGNSQLTVANTGAIVRPPDTDRIFQPFQRLDNRTTHDGFGLGLAIVASIAEIHGGTVTAHPRHEGGLSVTVTIPSASAAPHDTDIRVAQLPGVPLLR